VKDQLQHEPFRNAWSDSQYGLFPSCLSLYKTAFLQPGNKAVMPCCYYRKDLIFHTIKN